MKIRNGFVSNSSTSSFVLIMTKEKYEESTKDFDDDKKNAIATLASNSNFMGKDVVVFKDLTTQDGYSYASCALENLGSELHEAVDDYVYDLQKAAKEDDSMFIEEIDM